MVPVRGTFVLGDGSPATGFVTFTPAVPMVNGATVVRDPLTIGLDADGSFERLLAATDDPGTQPVGGTYDVLVQIAVRPTLLTGGGDVVRVPAPPPLKRRIVVPHAATSIDISLVSDAVDGPLQVAYDVAGAAGAAVGTHEAEADPHPQYVKSGLFQPLDEDLTAIAGLAPANDAVLQRKAGTWAARTPAQLKTDMNVAADIAASVAALVNSAPGTLDTLGELATALQADESAAAALATTVASKVASVGAGDSTIVVGGSATAPTLKVNPATLATKVDVTPATLAFLGDSITAAGAVQTSTATSLFTLGTGFSNWLQIYLRQRFTVVGTFGYGGQTVAQIRGHLADALAVNPKYLFIEAGINSIEGAVSAADIIADLDAMHAVCRDAGVTVLQSTITPSSGLTSTGASVATKKANIATVNAWITDEATRVPGVIAVPMDEAIDDGTGSPVTGTTYDGTHPSTYGAQLLGQAAGKILRGVIPRNDALLPATNSETWNALPNGLFTGTGGFLNFVANTGVASGWQASYGGTVTAVPTKVARSDGFGEWQQISITAGTAQNSPDNSSSAIVQRTIGPIPTSGGVVNVGDSVYAVLEFETDADWANASMLEVQLRDPPTTYKARALASRDSTDLKRAPFSGVIRTPTIVVGSSVNLVLLVFLGGLTAGTTATIRLGRAAIRKA